MERYTGRVEKLSDWTLLHANDGMSYILRRIGKDSILKSKMLARLDGRTLIFEGRRMGHVLFISKWMTETYYLTHNQQTLRDIINLK